MRTIKTAFLAGAAVVQIGLSSAQAQMTLTPLPTQPAATSTPDGSASPPSTPTPAAPTVNAAPNSNGNAPNGVLTTLQNSDANYSFAK